MVSDQGTKTVFSKYMLSAKVDTMILKNVVSTMKDRENVKVVSSLSYEAIKQDPDLMKHFVGLTHLQFGVLHNFHNDVTIRVLTFGTLRNPRPQGKLKTDADRNFQRTKNFSSALSG